MLEAEGDKQAAQLASEGFKIRLKNESEGQLVKVTNEVSLDCFRDFVLSIEIIALYIYILNLLNT